jgi:hypothetical protein
MAAMSSGYFGLDLQKKHNCFSNNNLLWRDIWKANSNLKFFFAGEVYFRVCKLQESPVVSSKSQHTQYYVMQSTTAMSTAACFFALK